MFMCAAAAASSTYMRSIAVTRLVNTSMGMKLAPLANTGMLLTRRKKEAGGGFIRVKLGCF